MDNLRALDVFVRVGRLGSFTAAANQMGVSRALASKLVMQLEQSLGVRLLYRTTRSVQLTEAGAIYHDFCARILHEIEDARLSVTTLQREPRGELRVLGPQSFGLMQLAPAIRDFHRLYPEIVVTLRLSDQLLDLVENRFDLALRIGPLPKSDLVVRHLCTIRWITCASPAYLKQFGTPQTPGDLGQHNCLNHTNVSPDHKWRYTDTRGTHVEVQTQGGPSTNSVAVLRDAALDGLGITRAPDFAVGSDLATKRLVALLPEWRSLASPLSVLYPHRRYVSAKVRAFVDYAVDRFAASPWSSGAKS